MQDLNSFRLQKISMIVADVILVAIGVIFAFSGEGPMSPLQALVVTFCVTMGAALGFIPFYLEFKHKLNFAAFELGQESKENTERIEAALGEIKAISDAVSQMADRAEQMSSKFEGQIGRFQAEAAKADESRTLRAKERSDFARELANLREDLTKAISETPGAEDTAALIGGIEVALANLSSQIEQLQFEQVKEAAARREADTVVDDFVPSSENESDEAVEPSDFSEDIADAEQKPETAREATPADPEPGFENVESTPEPAKDDEAAFSIEDVELGEDEDDDEDYVDEDSLSTDFLDEEAMADESSDDDDEPAQTDDAADETKPDAADDLTEPDTDESEAQSNEPIFVDARKDVPATVEKASAASKLDKAKREELEEFGEIEFSAPEPELDADDDEELDEPLEPETDLLGEVPPAQKKKRKRAPKDATTLVAQVLIGIGNKPYVRGTGPGLSTDKGVPMEFVEIGKWQWVAPESDEPVTCQIYRNDEIVAEGEEIVLEPGQRRTISPIFPV